VDAAHLQDLADMAGRILDPKVAATGGGAAPGTRPSWDELTCWPEAGWRDSFELQW
jgi:hypothetical protein